VGRGLEFSFQPYRNYASSIDIPKSFLIIYPRDSEQVTFIVNWAYISGKNVRVQGYRHTYSPLTVSEGDDTSKVLIIDMTRHMNKLKMGSQPIDFQNTRQSRILLTTVTAEPGASMQDLLTFAETNGFGIEMSPVIGGDATVGGVLAVNGHGAGIPAINEQLTSPGFTFGSVSNLIIRLQAVVWDSTANGYVLKHFDRTDPDIAAFLVHLGRAIITRVTIMVGSNYNLRCLSRVDVPADELFSHPANTNSGLRTMSSFMDAYGRINAIWFPFTTSPWIKVWQVSATKPANSRITTHPYNYQIKYSQLNPQTPGPVFGPAMLDRLVQGLTQNNVWDIWGASKNTILYFNASATPINTAGFVVLTNRGNIQLVLHEIVNFYTGLLNKYGDRGQYPIDQYIYIRVTSLDQPEDTHISGAVAPLISSLSPISTRPDFNVGVWINTLFTTHRAYSSEFMTEFEQWAYSRFNGGDGLARPEWSKSWGYGGSGSNNHGAFSNPSFLRETVPKVFGVKNWNRAVGILDKYDPHRVISNEFLRYLLVPYNNTGT